MGRVELIQTCLGLGGESVAECVLPAVLQTLGPDTSTATRGCSYIVYTYAI